MSAVAVLVVLCGSLAQAATITATYVNFQTADNVNFTAAGGLTNYGNAGLPASLAVGKFFRFGISISVSGNDATALSTYWAAGAVAGSQQWPSNLGAAAMAFQVGSSDPTGTSVAAVQGTPRGDGRNTSKAVLFDAANWTFATDVGDVLGTAAGTVNQLGSGQVGQSFQIYGGNATATPGNIARLAAPGSVFFNSLAFKVVGTGPVLLSPQIYSAGLNLWNVVDIGDIGDPDDSGDDVAPTFEARVFANSFGPGADTVVNPPILSINVPEPATMGLLALGLLGLVARRRSN